MLDIPQALRRGDKLPFAYGMESLRGGYWSFEDQAGRPSVLVFAGGATPAALSSLLDALDAAADALRAAGAQVRVLAPAGSPGWATAYVPASIELAHVMGVERWAKATGAPRLYLADRALRLSAEFDTQAPEAAVRALLDALQAMPREPARSIAMPAPVLVTPGVLDADACARLIARFEGGEHAAGAMASEDAAGAAVRRIDPLKKLRRDLALDPAEPLHGEVVQALSTRLVPEIGKAFQCKAAHLDRILIARYDDTGGWFKRHRDNSSAHLAYREFAVSLNLNTGDYEGGELLFPEFNDHRYSPPAGGALVFSASLLHEALPVTRGRRYVVLSFLHSDAAEARRRAALTAQAA